MITALLLAGVTVTLPLEVDVRGTELTIGQVATVTGDDPAEVAAAEAVRLGYAPAPGYSRLLRDWGVREELRRQAPQLEVALAGEPAVRVRPLVETLTPARLREVARAHVEARLGGADATATIRGELHELRVPAGEEPAELRVRVAPDEAGVPTGTFTVPVEVWVDGELYRTVRVAYDLEVWETVPVLVRDVPAGAAIAPTDLATRRVKVGDAGAGKPLAGALLVGAVAARDLTAGRVVIASDVHRPRVVAVGDDLFLEIRRGAVTARVACVARDAGAVGDRVRVEVAGDGRVLQAVVEGRELVVLDLGS